MLRLLMFVAAVVCAGNGWGQTVVDTSGQGVPDLPRILSLVAKDLKDPSSAQVRALRRNKRDGGYCGEVSAKNSYGDYVGYAPFYVGDNETFARILPHKGHADYAIRESQLLNEGCL